MAGWSADFAAGQLVPLTLLGEPLVLYRTEAGNLVALEDRCCHRHAPLSHGRLEGDNLRCMYHGLKFAPSGACVEMPGSNAIPPVMKVRVYPVVDRHSAAWVWMGAPEKANESLIPPFVGVNDPGWHMKPGHMDYDVYYELVQDNLLDLSHVAYVHRNTFAGGRDETVQAWSGADVRISQIDRGVRVARWMRNAPAPPHEVALSGTVCDVLSSFDYLVPGIFLLTNSYFRAGAFERCGGAVPDEEPVFSSFTAQAVTPLTARSTRYYFCFGPWSRAENGEQLKESFARLAYSAFAEDRTILTAQQHVIDADPSRKMLLFEVDRAPILYGRLVEKLLKEEAVG
jgi:phenylpropionate dioxygenase-like ring-hydroxylating dioxygenase large terminal subunit